MKPQVHAISSAVLAIIIYYFLRSLGTSLAVLISGIFIDLDHLFDFWKERPQNPFSIKEFLKPKKYIGKARKAYVPFHSYEIAILLWILAFKLNSPLILIGIASSLTLHLILDNIGNHLKPFAYFLIYRAVRKFQVLTD